MAGSRDERRPSEAASERGSLAPAQGPAGGGNNLRAPSRKFPAAAAAETAASSQGATNQNYAKGINAPTAPAATEPWWLADHYTYVSIDRAFKANLARLTFGFSPAVLAEQTFDWLAHLAISPRRQLQLLEKWYRKNTRIAAYAAQSLTNPPCRAASRRCGRIVAFVGGVAAMALQHDLSSIGADAAMLEAVFYVDGRYHILG